MQLQQSDMKLLLILSKQREVLNKTQLVKLCHLNQNTVHSSISRLTALGLARNQHSQSRRPNMIKITDKGQRVAKHIKIIYEQVGMIESILFQD